MMLTTKSVHRLTVVALGAALVLSGCGGSGAKSTTSAGNAASLVQQGLAKEKAGDVAGARALFEQAATADPANKYAQYNLGYIDQSLNATDKAIKEYRAALALDPRFEPALYNLAIVLTSSNPAEAVSLYQQAVAVNALDASAQLNLGLLLIAQGDSAGGNEHLQAAVKLNPSLASRTPAPSPSPSASHTH